MPYTFTINNNSGQTLNFTDVIKEPQKTTHNNIIATEPSYSEEVLEASEVLQMTPEEIVEAAEYYQMTPDDYAFTMMLSKKINRKVSNRLRDQFKL